MLGCTKSILRTSTILKDRSVQIRYDEIQFFALNSKFNQNWIPEDGGSTYLVLCRHVLIPLCVSVGMNGMRRHTKARTKKIRYVYMWTSHVLLR